MKCLSDSKIQAYLDGEMSPRQRNRVERHLQQCPTCANRVEEQRAKISMVFSVLNLVNNTENKHQYLPLKNTGSDVEASSVLSSNRKNWLGNVASVAAIIVVVLAFALVIRQNMMGEIRDMTGNQIIVRYEIDGEFDANRPVTEQDYVFRVYQQ